LTDLSKRLKIFTRSDYPCSGLQSNIQPAIGGFSIETLWYKEIILSNKPEVNRSRSAEGFSHYPADRNLSSSANLAEPRLFSGLGTEVSALTVIQFSI
jgi:hypothetical protein